MLAAEALLRQSDRKSLSTCERLLLAAEAAIQAAKEVAVGRLDWARRAGHRRSASASRVNGRDFPLSPSSLLTIFGHTSGLSRDGALGGPQSVGLPARRMARPAVQVA